MITQHFASAASAILLAFALVGHDGGASSASVADIPESALANPAPPALPLKGRCATTFYQPPEQPPPPLVLQIDEGTCHLTHLGIASFFSIKEINFATGTQVTTEASFTAANGDILYAMGMGTSAMNTPGQVDFSATLILVGGTGRFTNATGEASVEGTAFLASQTAAFEIVEGWISYGSSEGTGL